MHACGLWEEAGVPREIEHTHGENMQATYRKAPAEQQIQTQDLLAVRRRR